VFYLTHLQGKLEDNMFRSHIAISNLNEILAGEVIRFNILLVVISLLLVIIFYTIVRLRLKSFFGKIKKAVYTLQERTKAEPSGLKIPGEFYEIDRVMGEFIQYTYKKLEEEDNKISSVKVVIKKETG
jgi:Flp pilus assembly pilin Flp